MATLSKPTKGIIVAIISFVTLGCLVSFWWSTYSALIPLAASVGGMIVFLGLWIEKEADDETKKEQPASLAGDARYSRKSEIGWWILMAGIFMEIITGCGLAAYDVWKAEKTAIQIAKNDPLKQPVTSLSAIVKVRLKNAQIERHDPETLGMFVFLELGRREQTNLNVFSAVGPGWRFNANSNFWIANLACKSVTHNNSTNDAILIMEFGPDPWEPNWNLQQSDTVESVAKWNICVLSLGNLFSTSKPVGTNMELLEGSVRLLVNSTKVELPIPAHPQTVGTMFGFPIAIKLPAANDRK
jgi:hypothetical protein